MERKRWCHAARGLQTPMSSLARAICLLQSHCRTMPTCNALNAFSYTGCVFSSVLLRFVHRSPVKCLRADRYVTSFCWLVALRVPALSNLVRLQAAD